MSFTQRMNHTILSMSLDIVNAIGNEGIIMNLTTEDKIQTGNRHNLLILDN